MHLSDWLLREKITQAQFAGRIGVTQAAVHRYLHADRIPTRAVMARIYKVTRGEVGPNDWYDLGSGKKKGRVAEAPPLAG